MELRNLQSKIRIRTVSLGPTVQNHRVFQTIVRPIGSESRISGPIFIFKMSKSHEAAPAKVEGRPKRPRPYRRREKSSPKYDRIAAKHQKRYDSNSMIRHGHN